jgi:sulfur-oxidizing protein SoxZ
MARNKKPRIRLPKKIQKGDILEVRVQQRYPSETGLDFFPDTDDFIRKEPAVYLKKMTAYYNGKVVGEMLMSAAVSANPRISFPLRVSEPGELKVVFESNKGEKFEETKEVKF